MSRISGSYSPTKVPVGLGGENNYQSESSFKSTSPKRKILEKYRESPNARVEDLNMESEFELDNNKDMDLSYSKFSQLSGISALKGLNSSTLEHSGSLGFGNSAKRVHDKLQDIRLDNDKNENRWMHVKGDRDKIVDPGAVARYINEPDNVNTSPIYSIQEQQEVNDENNPGFIHPPNPNNFRNDPTSTPEKLIIPRPRDPLNLKPRHLHNSNKDKKVTVLSPPQSTPRNQTKRNVSVKVSLTPAQRVEKKLGIRLTNALENFQFEEMVGRGAYATVYKGTNLKTGQVVAIKQILLENDQDVQALMGEIDLLKILKHPNIVKYHGFVKTSDSLNVFLEFCAGGSLRQLYKRYNSGLPEQQIISFVNLILHGLNYLHEQGVVHRDVKAANVLITETGDVKLADFGVATKVTSQHQSVVGTPNWMAPETVLGGEGLCTASDIWSLGATIIELFTTNPPYHDLNPMATLHAIGTDDHPPLPKNTSSIARDFLLECFQKQPSLRITAKLLLKHKWLNQDDSLVGRRTSHNFAEKNMHSLEQSQIHSGHTDTSDLRYSLRNFSATNDGYSLNRYSETGEENWEKDFGEFSINKGHVISPTSSKFELDKKDIKVTDLNRHERLNNFVDSNDENDINEEAELVLDLKNMTSQNYNDHDGDMDDDPFLNIELDNFDTNELEIQSKMEFLITKFTNRVDLCENGNEDIANSLIKIMGKICHLVKKYSILHDVLIRDHGILSIFELLENVNDLPNLPKLWYYSLSTLNFIFENNLNQFENFCLLGGIPVVTQFRSNKFDTSIKQQVVRFIRLFLKSNKALSMFISCGGLRVLSKLAEEDFETNPVFPITSIDCLYSVLTEDFSSSKSDICRKLSHYGVIFWFIVLLNRLVKLNVANKEYDVTIDKILQILKFFGQSEVKVRINISSSDLFKILMKTYPGLHLNHQLIILKFMKSMSCILELLKHLHSADILEFLVLLIKEHTPTTPNYKEFINIICPILYNYCYLNHAREIELVTLGAVPYLRELSKINLPFRQFILPILCELVYCDKFVRTNLIKHKILDVYLNLVLDPYWQANSLDSILNWLKQDSSKLLLTNSNSLDCLVTGFTLNKISNLESALDNYLQLVTINHDLRQLFTNNTIIENILTKLSNTTKNSVVQLTLLRILKVLLWKYQISRRPHHHSGHLKLQKTQEVLRSLASRKNSLLVDELANEIVSIISDHPH